jgi:hypothetical protein
MNKNDFRINIIYQGKCKYILQRKEIDYEFELFGLKFGRRESWVTISDILTKEDAQKALQEIQEYYS